ncbi:MAG: hypothetical protein DWQ47_16095 [Acidobacteria bacterium]|nr:MAG: hypothetical protein DWQ32_03495 [Acidobacteriota bacterium]REK02424.1 MAG: hypothetical protein DWQ38_08640 [Acidobacteriota bacterium]REK13775.1 MAG: hypothetical protein DWQ43_09185 [Acidobacteriota bacterium]REK41769.1 MAG: hypothetical protein DWQ47_16095 [Acidobacteriota bacterium]
MILTIILFCFTLTAQSRSQAMTKETAGQPVRTASGEPAGAVGRETADGKTRVFQGRKFIVFVVGGSNYAVDSQTVSEVVRDLSPTRLPNTPDWLLGIANLRSEIVTVVELDTLLSGEKAEGSQSPKHIVIRLKTMDALIAFRVEKLREIITVDKTKIKAADVSELAFVSGKFEHKGESFTVVNVGELVESLKQV